MVYLLFAIGFIFLIKGGDLLVDGASSLAKRFGISSLAIGLTVVSFGTSAPELIVNVIASFRGASDIGVGNILGSNISNIFLILGISALIYPLAVKKTATWKGIPLNLLAAVALFVMANDALIDGETISILTRIDGFILILFFIIFVYYTFGLARHEEEDEEDTKEQKLPISIIMVLIGILGLYFGGRWVIDGAIEIASVFGWSEKLIGLTIVAVGTSLPELAASAIAAYKRKADIAVGNVVGSNLFNIFWVLGVSALIKPLPFNPQINLDILFLIATTIIFFVFVFIGKKGFLDRTEGGIFVGLYIFYLIFVIIRG